MGALAEAGVTLVGENRQQDLAAKHERWGDAFEWDFIGNLQSRKVKQLLPLCRLIHSVATDSALAAARPPRRPGDRGPGRGQRRRRGGQGRRRPGDLGDFIERCPVRVGGLMTMPPFSQDPEASRPHFARLAELAGEHGLRAALDGHLAGLARSRSRRGRRSSAWARRCSCESALTCGIIGKGVGRRRPKHPIPWPYATPGIERSSTSASPRITTTVPSTRTTTSPRPAPRKSSKAAASASRRAVRRLPTSRRARRDEIDDIFADDEPIAASRTRTLRPVDNGDSDVQVHLVIPRNFNDAQQVADQFKRSVPVILNLQTTDHELSKRMIDFCSGLTYALDGGMQRIAEKIFLLTPRNVEVSAEEKARLIDKGFFNQS